MVRTHNEDDLLKYKVEGTLNKQNAKTPYVILATIERMKCVVTLISF